MVHVNAPRSLLSRAWSSSPTAALPPQGSPHSPNSTSAQTSFLKPRLILMTRKPPLANWEPFISTPSISVLFRDKG